MTYERHGMAWRRTRRTLSTAADTTAAVHLANPRDLDQLIVVSSPTDAVAGCLVALREGEPLAILRWLRPSAHPVIEVGTTGQVTP